VLQVAGPLRDTRFIEELGRGCRTQVFPILQHPYDLFPGGYLDKLNNIRTVSRLGSAR